MGGLRVHREKNCYYTVINCYYSRQKNTVDFKLGLLHQLILNELEPCVKEHYELNTDDKVLLIDKNYFNFFLHLFHNEI